MTQLKDKHRSREIQALVNDSDFLKDIIQSILQEFLETEITGFLGATPYERVKERKGHRNGYKPRLLRTRVGTLNLLVPKDREGRFQTRLFERYQRSEKALVLALQEMYLQGVSTRKATGITERLCGTGFSKSQVSALTARLDTELETWRNRPLSGQYPYETFDLIDRIPRSLLRGYRFCSSAVRNSGGTKCQEIGLMPRSLLRG